MGKGRKYENDIAAEIHFATGPEVKVYTCGYSGNNRYAQPDITVTCPSENHAIEMKKTGDERFYIDSDDIGQLLECEGPNTSVWLMMKFNHREPMLVRYYGNIMGDDEYNKLTPVEKFADLIPDCFDPHVTNSGNLRLSKPDTDQWSSSQAGREDHVVVLSELGIENESSWEL